MNKIFEQIGNLLEDWLGSPLFRATFFTWIFWNWKFLYITFFVSVNELPYGIINKLEYIELYYPIDSYKDKLFTSLDFVIIPLLAAFFTIKYFSIIEIYFFDKHHNNIAEKKNILNILQLEEERSRADVLSQRKTNRTMREEQEKLWEKEYNELKNKDIFNGAMSSFNVIIHKGGGLVLNTTESIISFLNLNDLIHLDQRSLDKGGMRIRATDKGKFFLKKFTNEHLEES